jgi:molybdopterin-containing oxidoreductase family membrane subunit
VIGGQAFPMTLFADKEILESGFYDGVVATYAPSLPEVLLGIGGVAVALAGALVAIRVLRFLPQSLADEDVDPHASASAA